MREEVVLCGSLSADGVPKKVNLPRVCGKGVCFAEGKSVHDVPEYGEETNSSTIV